MSIGIKSSAAISGVDLWNTPVQVTPAENKFEFPCLLAAQPDYNDFINVRAQRRMGKLLKMSVGCALKTLHEAEVSSPDAIVVGTALGCLNRTERFLHEILDNNEGVLSPTSFIQSTHNTIAGQIALLQKCNGYNYTYSQRERSFENALTDAIMLLEEGEKNVLLGAADEVTPSALATVFTNGCLTQKVKGSSLPFGEGAAFFLLTQQKAPVKILHSSTIREDHLETYLEKILVSKNIKIDDVLIMSLNPSSLSNNRTIPSILDFSPISGVYFTAMAIGLHLGFDYLTAQHHIIKYPTTVRKDHSHVLVHNGGIFGDHSFILLCRS